MANIVIMRHGEAEPLMSQDSQRQLTESGKHEVTQMALWLQQHYAAFDWIWSSPYIRTQQTAQLMLAKQAPFSQLEIVTDLQPEADAALLHDYIDARLSEKPDARILLVSHMPLVSFLIENLTIAGNTPVMCTGAVVCIEYQPGSQGRLVTQLCPDDLQPATVC